MRIHFVLRGIENGLVPPSIHYAIPGRGAGLFLTKLCYVLSTLSVAHGGEEVLVEATAPDENAPFGVTIIRIDETLPSRDNLGDVIDRAPGTQLRRFGGLGDYTAIGIRGSAMRQVQVFLDGIPLNPDGIATVNLSEWPLQAFSEVQIYRGNLPIRFAAAPIGGAINLISHETPPPVSLRAGVGQYGTGRVQLMGWNLGRNGLDGLMLVDAQTTQGDYRYFDDRGTPYNRIDDRLQERQNNDKRWVNGLARWRHSTGGSEFSLLVAPMLRNEGLPGHTNTPTRAANLKTNRNLTTIRYQTEKSQYRNDSQLWHQLRLEDYDDRESELGTGSDWSRQRTEALGLLNSFDWFQSESFQLHNTITVRRDHYRNTNRIDDSVELSPRRTNGSVAVAASWWPARETFLLYPAFHVQSLNARLDSEGSQNVSAHPRLAMTWLAGKNVSLYSNAGHFIRPPDYFELFGDRGSIIGNPELVPEQSLQLDLGLRLTEPSSGPWRSSLELTGFFNQYTDQIVYVQNAQRTMNPTNLARSLVAGLEGAGTFTVEDRFDLVTSITVNHSRNKSPIPGVQGNQLPSVPFVDASALGSVFWDEWARIGLSWNFVGQNYWDATNWYRSASRQTVGVFARLGLPSESLYLELNWLNLANRIVEVQARNPLNPADPSQILSSVTDFVGYPLPGRTWYLELHWRPK